MKFRRKQVVIDAYEYRAGEQHYGLAEDVIAGRIEYKEEDCMLIAAPEGTYVARPGDWIIRYKDGRLVPCKAYVFERLYEPVEEP